MEASPSFLVAPDSFKGSFSAREVAAGIVLGLRRAGARAELCAAADGGEGTTVALVGASGGRRKVAFAHDPLGRPIEASYALLSDGSTAVVEVAQASGLGLVAEHERDAEAADSRGTGELIAAAIAAGATRVLVAAGGSATTDGGAGAIDAVKEAGGTGDAKLEVLCDTRVPFERAAEVFAPQKGADPEAVRRLAERLIARAGALPRDPRGKPMTGAAGGLAGGLWAAFGARLVPGAAFVLGALGFDRMLDRTTAVITGEGRLDEQSLEGKLVGEIAKRCREADVPLHVITAQNRLPAPLAESLHLSSVREAGSIIEIARSASEIAAAG